MQRKIAAKKKRKKEENVGYIIPIDLTEKKREQH